MNDNSTMEQIKHDFIGNGTILDTYVTAYWQKKIKYREGSRTMVISRDELAALEETRMKLDSEIHSIAGGIEAIGQLLAANDIKDMGVSDNTWANLGYLLTQLGKNMGSYYHLHDHINYNIETAEIKD